ncbi:MAG: DUF2723 domain-containing protein [Chloroflexota bacterium]
MPRFFASAAISRPVRRSPAVFISIFLSLLYLRTMAPGLTWAFDGADGGDLIAAAATGGVPHPTGYPTYLLLASALLQLPFGPVAFRTNLLSLAATVLAAWVLYALVQEATRSVLAAALASIVFGTSPLVWSQAIITEVYALQALLTVLFLGLLLASRPRRSIELALGLVAGLSIGNHLMGALLLPLLLLRPESPGPAAVSNAARPTLVPVSLIKVYLERLLGLGAGLAIYLVIPLRASSHSPVNWGNVNSPQTLFSFVTGQMYWGRLQQSTAAYLISGARSWADFMSEQLTVAGLLLATLGLIVLFRHGILHIVTIWMAISSSFLAIIYRAPDSYVYLIPVVISCSIWIGLGSRWPAELPSGRLEYGGAAATYLILGFFLLRGVLAVPRMDLSSDRRAEDFGRAVLASAPDNAILVAQGDEATFTLWYFHYALHQRPDVSVVSRDLLTQPWYLDVLRYSYADLDVPMEFSTSALGRANPGRTVCTVALILPPRLDCGQQAGRQTGGT